MILSKKIFIISFFSIFLITNLYAEKKKEVLERNKPIEFELQDKKDPIPLLDDLTSFEADRLEKYLKFKEEYKKEYNFNASSYNVEIKYENVLKEFLTLISDTDDTFEYSLKKNDCKYHVFQNEKNETDLNTSFFDCNMNKLESKNLIINLDKKFDNLKFDNLYFSHIPKEYDILEKNLIETGLILKERKTHLINKLKENNESLIPKNIYQGLSFKEGNKIIKSNTFDFLTSIDKIEMDNVELLMSFEYIGKFKLDKFKINNISELMKLFLNYKLNDFKEPKIISFEIVNPQYDFIENKENYENLTFFTKYFDIKDLDIKNYFSDKYIDFFNYLHTTFTPKDKINIKGNLEVKLISEKFENEEVNYLNYNLSFEIIHPKIGNVRIASNMFLNLIDLKFKDENILNNLIIQDINIEIDSALLKREFENYLAIKEKKLRKDNLKNSFKNEWVKEFIKIDEIYQSKNNLFDEKIVKQHFIPFMKFEKEKLKINFVNKNVKRIKALKVEIPEKIKQNQSFNEDFILFLDTF